MDARFVVLAGYVTAETAVPGGRAMVDIPRGSVLPSDVPAEQVQTLLRLGQIASQPIRSASPSVTEIPAKVADILAWVGEDLDRARQALNTEQARDKPRPTLVGPLGDLLNQ